MAGQLGKHHRSRHKKARAEAKKPSTAAMGILIAFAVAAAAFFFFLNRWEAANGVAEDDGLADDFHGIYGLDAMGVVSFTDENENDRDYIYKDDIETYLVIGTDASGNQDTSEGEEYRGKMADFLALAVFDKTKKTFEILQLNRETMTDIPLIDYRGEGEATRVLQLCTAHWFGSTQEMSAKNTVRAVSDLLGGLDIKGYFELDMDSIGDVNHALGGVTVTIEDEELAEAYPDLPYGETITLSDEQAWEYVHARMEVGDECNENRMRRQKTYLTAAIKKATESAKADSEFADAVYGAIKDMVFTNVYGNYASRFANYLKSYENLGIVTIPGTSKVGYTLDDGLPHSEFYVTQEDVILTMGKVYHLELFE